MRRPRDYLGNAVRNFEGMRDDSETTFRFFVIRLGFIFIMLIFDIAFTLHEMSDKMETPEEREKEAHRKRFDYDRPLPSDFGEGYH